MLPVDILYHGDRANSVLGVLVALLLLFFATVTDFMKKADVFSKNGRIGDGEKRVLELWMTSQQTPVMKVTGRSKSSSSQKPLPRMSVGGRRSWTTFQRG